MSCIIIYDEKKKRSSFACTTTDVCFGPLMRGTREKITAFWDSLDQDARAYKDQDLEDLYVAFDRNWKE